MPASKSFPELRVRALNGNTVNSSGDFVLYWMVASRRTHWNFGLQRAVEWANELRKPLLVLEALRCNYRWASDRLHWFVIQGMADNAARFADSAAAYFPYLEPSAGEGAGMLASLAEQACVLVSDDFPCFFLPKMQAQVARRLPVSLELVDSNGLLPMRATDRVFARAHDFRRFLHKELPPFLEQMPERDPLSNLRREENLQLPGEIIARWSPADLAAVAKNPESLQSLPIDHTVTPAVFDGGELAGRKALQTFLNSRLDRYSEDRNQPEQQATSGLSPYLHFGHISSHEVFQSLVEKAGWNTNQLAHKPTGSRNGWWGMSEANEGFLDQLITWRELGFNAASKQPNYARYSSLPDWAQQTLGEHASDTREYTYRLEEFENARTHDELWNAAQRQLVSEGQMHNYLRMLWGKKILHWSASPRAALKIMIELNNKYAVDGRNPNSYSGIMWTLGKYDRPWGPERPIFGKIRYMTSDSTRRKLRVDGYLKRYSGSGQSQLF